MLAASESIAGADGPLNVVPGVGVVLIFVGSLIRAVTARRRTRKQNARPGLPLHRSGGPEPAYATPPSSPLHEPPRPESDGQLSPLRPAAVPEVAEPELARLSSASLAPLGQSLEVSRCLRAADDRVVGELAALPDGFWLVERDVVMGNRRIPILVLGATGVFVICATDGACTLHDLHVMSELADNLREELPGYDGPVHAAVCLAFDRMAPRTWYGGEQQHGRGGWLLGVDWLLRWLFSFGPEHGLRNGDIRRLDEAARPFRERRSIARLPSTRNFG